MALLIPRISVAQAATLINILIAALQYTLALALAALLVYCIPAVNPALAWNVIGRRLHASPWATLLRAETVRGTGARVALFAYLSLATTLLVAVAGVVMPLGLSSGPMLQAPLKGVPAAFVADASPLGLATSPRQPMYGRVCGGFRPVACPGNAVNTTVIPQAIVDQFNASAHGPFGMQFRRYYNGTAGYHYPMSVPQFTMTESLILRNGIFAVEGLIVDLDNPGVGLWNHTMPSGVAHGGVWSEDLLWLEPVTSCVDTNLTIDYTLAGTYLTYQVEKYNLTDRGGFYNLTHEYPTFNRDGQNLNLGEHAYKGAVLSNFYTMRAFNNMTRNASHPGRALPVNSSTTHFFAGKLQPLSMLYMGQVDAGGNLSFSGANLQTACVGYGGQDIANISNVAVHCGLFLGPPQRTDGGDARLPADNSTWTQRMFACASATRARMQRVEFASNGTMDLAALRIARSDIATPVLWGMEKSDILLSDVDLLWGRVPDAHERAASLWTTRSDVFYVPAGATDIWGVTTGGMAGVLPAMAWTTLENPLSQVDYSGVTNFALLRKFQSMLLRDPLGGAAQIKNLMWTDLMANNVMGSDSRTSLLVGENVPSVSYDLRYAIPALLLILLWLPSVIGAAFVLLTGLLKISYLRYLLSHTSAGRIALGDSALRPVHQQYMAPATPMAGATRGDDETRWAKGAGRVPVWVEQGEDGYGHGKERDFAAVATHER